MEEAYELADAAHAGDDASLLDELGDVLFQVHFLSLLLEERGAGDLGAVAEHCAAKLIRRHPHVFGEVEASDAAAVLRNWDSIKRQEQAAAPEAEPPPRSLPAMIYARKVQRRAAAAGGAAPGLEGALARVAEQARELAEMPSPGPAGERMGPGEDPLREQRFEAVGELLFEAVAASRRLGVDGELALRAAAARHEPRVEAGGAAESEGQ